MQCNRIICRLCGQGDEITYYIFDSDDNLEEKIKKCLNIEISKGDFKPKQVCGLCYNKLIDFSNFIDSCYATNLKLESIYYSEQWHHSSDRTLYEPIGTPKQSVIVSTRQSHDHSSLYYHQPNTDESMGVLPTYGLSQSDPILDFSVNYNNIQPVDIQNCFNECNTFNKQENITPIEPSSYAQNGKVIKSCLVNENDPSELLDSVENEPNSISNSASSCRALVSVDDVRKSLETVDSLLKIGNSNLKTKNSYSCMHCEKKFVRRSNLNAHISVHTKIKPYVCSICSKTFAVKCHLTQHKKIHLDIFVCQVCLKKFDVPSKLSRHMQIHSKNKPFICSFADCKKSFSDKNNLKQHILIHSTEKKFSCIICMKEFKTKKNLKAHVTSHVNICKFQCKFCQKPFKYKHNLKSHMSKHTNNSKNKIS